MIPFLPVIVIGGAVLAAWKRPWQKKMSTQQTIAYETAMRTMRDPAKLRELASAYKKEGFKKQAEMLGRRAICLELPEATKVKHRECFEKAMKSTNPDAIENIASAFELQGQTIVAGELRKYASGLRAAESAS